MAQSKTINLDDVAFVGVQEAAAFLGIGRSAAYAAIRSGTIPSIRVGRSWRIPTAALRQLAGLDK
mgnify:CR=1 FL=1